MQKVLDFLKDLGKKVVAFINVLTSDRKKMIIAIAVAAGVLAGIIVATVFGVKNYNCGYRVVYVDEDTGKEYTQSEIDAVAEWWAGVEVGQEGNIEVKQ